MTVPPHRAIAHLTRVSGLFPKFHREFERMRADRGRGLPDWPTWCYCPMAGAYVAELAGLAAWRPTKGIYRFDPDLGRALVDTPLDGELPREILHRLPEWCVYVETVGLVDGVDGFFAHLEHDSNDGRTELRLLLDTGPDDTPHLAAVPLHLVEGGLVASVQAFADEGVSQAALQGAGWTSALPRSVVGTIADRVRPLVSLLLYLCSEEPDYAGEERPRIPRLTKTAKGMRLPTADAPRTWEVGMRIGAAIRRASEAPERVDEGGSHASPRPHVRRAHWATYWTGPKAQPQKPLLRWLSPILVGAGETVATVRKVTDR